MALTPGVRLGAYEIVRLIGAGGMGEVYQARDARLDRFVAIKVLAERFAADPFVESVSNAKRAPLLRSITRISAAFTTSATLKRPNQQARVPVRSNSS